MEKDKYPSQAKISLTDVAWSLFALTTTAVAITCFGVLLDEFYEVRPGPYEYPYSIGWYSISEMLITVDPETKCYVQSGLLLSVWGSLVLFLSTNDRAVVRTVLQKIHNVSFIVAVPACQLVVTICYDDSFDLHMTFAGLFFTFAAISGTTGALLEYRHGNNNVWRATVQYLSTALIWVCLGGLLSAVFTYTDIPIIDRRPPLVIGEFAGVLSFIFQSAAKLPLLTRAIGRKESDASNAGIEAGERMVSTAV
jgi:hypothetical protein